MHLRAQEGIWYHCSGFWLVVVQCQAGGKQQPISWSYSLDRHHLCPAIGDRHDSQSIPGLFFCSLFAFLATRRLTVRPRTMLLLHDVCWLPSAGLCSDGERTSQWKLLRWDSSEPGSQSSASGGTLSLSPQDTLVPRVGTNYSTRYYVPI